MKILITGTKGQLGNDCAQVLSRTREVTAVGRDELDITRLFDVEAMVESVAPDIIINCAAYTRVDDSETDQEVAWNVNVKGAENLALTAKKTGSQLIHISTDYVFDGSRTAPEPYTEDDEPNPVSYYGVTKLESEVVVKRLIDRHVIIRTAWTYGANGRNFLKTILKSALSDPGRELKVVSDQLGCPTWTHRLALQIEQLINSDGRGVYHATSEGYCSWYELATYFLKQMSAPNMVIPCTSREYPMPATRPKNSILENRRLKNQGIDVMRPWQEDVERFVSGFREKLIHETD